MDILKAFSTDKELENSGVWVDIGDGTILCVARMYNDRYNELLRGAIQPHKRKELTSDESIEIMIDVEARAILVGWEGVTENGEDVPYSVEKVKEYLRLRDFRKKILEIANSMEAYKAQELEDGEKN